MTIHDLTRFLGRTVTLRMTNREIVKIKVEFIDEDDENIVAAVIESSHPERYRSACAMRTFAAGDIVSAEVSE